MATFIVKSAENIEGALLLIKGQTKFPFTVKVTEGAPRSTKQNRLYRKWLSDLAQQGDLTASQYNAYCKLHFGVPIMRAADAEYAATYDQFVKKTYTYDQKLKIMEGDYGWPVTSAMNPKQFTEFLNAMKDHFIEQGFHLTEPKKDGV